MSVVELTTFTVSAERTSEMLAARPAMLAAFRDDRRGFRSAQLVRLDEDRWLDIVVWTDAAALDASRRKGANQPAITAFFDTIAELVSSESAVRYDDDVTPGAPGPSVRTVAYGPRPAQVGELYLPAGHGPHPVAVLIHGGFWSARYDRRLMVPLALDLVDAGYAAWNIDYRGIGNGGGWPGTFEDVAAAIDALDGLDPTVDSTRVTVIGHSAGGQLAVWASARGRLPAQAPGHDPRVLPSAVVSLAGVLDLIAGEKEQVGAVLIPGGAVRGLLGGQFPEVPERYEWTSPALLPTDVPTLAVHGTADDLVPVCYSQVYHRAVTAGGTPAELVELPSVGHFELIEPTSEGWRVVRNWSAAHR